MTKEKIHQIEEKHPDFEERAEHWKITSLLMGGTLAMRKNHNDTLPQYQREPDENYNARVSGSVLYNATREKVIKFSKKPFAEKVKFSADLPPEFDFIYNNIDGNGCTLDKYLEQNIKRRLVFGHAINMVKGPNLFDDNGVKVSEAEVKNKQLYPFVATIHSNSLISWSYDSQGMEMAKIQYEVMEYDGENIKKNLKIDKWTRNDKVTWTKTSEHKDGWTAAAPIENEIKEIPIVISGDLYGRPEVEDMAHLNLTHFRKSSALDSYENLACVPFLFFKGFDPETTEVKVSVNQAYFNKNQNSNIEWIELEGGEGLKQASTSLDKLEAKLQASGADIVTEKSASQKETTATENVIHDDDKMSPLQSIVVDEVNAFVKILRFMSMWMDVKVPDVALIIFKNFNITKRANTKIEQLLKARASGEISRETFLKGLEEVKFFSDDFEIEEEIQRLEDSSEI